MRIRILMVVLVLLSFAIAFSYASRPQTTGDDLAIALANHGLDPSMSPLAAQAVELAITNSNALGTRLANLEAGITPSRPSSKGYTVTIPAAYPMGQSSAVGIPNRGGCGDTWDKLQFGSAGSGTFYDYIANVPVEADYILTVRACVGTVLTVPLSMHIEIPAGTPALGIFSLIPSATSAFNVTPAGTIHLKPGPQVLRLVIESTPNAVNYIQWIRLEQQ